MTRPGAGWVTRVRRAARGRGAGRAEPPERPTPLTTERVAAELARRGYHFRTSPGQITGTWDGHRVWFRLLGDENEILQVRGRWGDDLPAERRTVLLRAVNDWNRDRRWPRAHVEESDDRLTVWAEVSVDYEQGATSLQLEQTVTCGLASSIAFFESVDGLVALG
ncbi:YbjN domain-containing protein [Cellulomonas sp. PhB143]|uniref:YbjN domain-containing protein n=1 Tax=Cellulomonas sp. PhB143 TaxID=2485186 RepID=UPI000FC25BEC|nr:YbjN domain-containing protein [Cellulomonas sp. PhB143]ROS77177.1 putative sensory transduction regulator [Cellulomonas sp. PhB143]